jgi:hypothetical protein
MTITLKNKKGGILNDLLPGKDSEKTFYNFIENSTLSYVSRGGNGIIYKAVVKPGYTSSYKYIYSDSFNEPVKEFVLKLAILLDNENRDIDHFKNEVNTQANIFLDSHDYLQPLCPAIVYSDILKTPKSKRKLIDILLNNPELKKHKILYDKEETALNEPDLIRSDGIYFGIIAMEYARGYKTLWDIIKRHKIDDETIVNYINYSLYAILTLALDHEYAHGDFHSGNIMIHPDIEYFSGLKGRAMLIDFGFTIKIPKKNMDIIREHVKKKQYIEALKQLCYIPRGVDGELPGRKEWNNFYGWVCNDWDILKGKKSDTNISFLSYFSISKNIKYTSNEDLHTLFEKRKEQTDKISKDSFSKKVQNSDYPILPLDPRYKKRMFHKIHGGKKRHNRKTRKSTRQSHYFQQHNKSTYFQQ